MTGTIAISLLSGIVPRAIYRYKIAGAGEGVGGRSGGGSKYVPLVHCDPGESKIKILWKQEGRTGIIWAARRAVAGHNLD